MPPLTPDQVAQVAHEANRIYCRSLGDFTQHHWDHAPAHARASALAGVKAHLEKPRTPRQSHELWLKHKEVEGWTYGPVKNEDTRQHPCFVPYDDLPDSQRVKDEIFAGIVKTLAPLTR